LAVSKASIVMDHQQLTSQSESRSQENFGLGAE